MSSALAIRLRGRRTTRNGMPAYRTSPDSRDSRLLAIAGQKFNCKYTLVAVDCGAGILVP